ncbi:MAG: flippase-like domain-containing protein [Muribaculaceae bacterium]|nr:flippase-like domain-containing protein [Muribaculaceae bacterium]
MLRKIISYIIPLLIGVGLFYFLWTNVDSEQLFNCLRYDVNYWWFVLIAFISIWSHIFRALRWRLQLRAIGIDAPLHALICSIFGTYAVNLIFPRLGEVWRCGYIAERQKASFTKVVGSMVADRLSDTLTVLTLTVFTFFLAQEAFYAFLDTYPEIKENLWNMITSPSVWLCLTAAILLIVWLFRSHSSNKWIAKIRTMATNMWQGFIAITKMEGKWQFLFYTIMIWGCYFVQLFLAKYAFTFTHDLSVTAMLVLFVLSSIGMGVPTNGGLGAYHVAIIFGLSLYGVGVFDTSNFDPQASAFAMLEWGIQTVLLVILGIYTAVYIAIDKHRISTGKTIVKTSGDKMKL